jgi:uncharacterized membrane protein YuzA (DUF378 family)
MSSYARILVLVVVCVAITGLATGLAGFHNLIVVALLCTVNAFAANTGYSIGIKDGRSSRS